MKNNPYVKDKKHKKQRDEAEVNETLQEETVLNEEINEDEENAVKEEDTADDVGFEGGGEIGILNKKIENLEARLKEKDDEILRRAADTDNYRKRLEKEADDRMKYANQAISSDFIGVLDNIELTLQYAEKGSQLYEGIELTIKSFKDTLSKYGVKEVDSEIGTKFAPAVHEGIMLDNNADYPNDVITLCVQKGYSLNDRLIRPAKVRVNKI